MDIRILSSPFSNWRVSNADESIKVDAKVPGQVQLDLLNSGIIQDPYINLNDTKTRWVGTTDWKYSTIFYISKVDGKYFLECQGLDTICIIILNGKEIGATDNQFVKYMFSVAVITGENRLELYFKNPVEWAYRKSIDYPYPVPDGFAIEQNGVKNRNFIRKEQCSFSWDWGPCCLPIGIWKDLKLIGISKSVYLTDWTVDLTLRDSNFVLDVNIWVVSHGMTSYYVSLEIKELDQSCKLLCSGDKANLKMIIPMDKVEFWYPAGYGTQRLYSIQAVLSHDSPDTIALGKFEKKVGFRTAQLVQEKYQDGRPGASFFFRVNGIDIFAKGTNWIPADAFESRVAPSKIRKFLVSCKEANMNMIRVWGGGIYQPDCFYEICDELGILIWQEFMFACAMYPVDASFLSTVSKEVRTQVKRLMSHPCLILWSGNNENEEALVNGWYLATKRNPFIYTIDYHRLYHETIMASVLDLDPNRQFISSSPNNGFISTLPFVERFISDTGNDDDYGDAHYYNYKDKGTDVSTFRSPRFMSEYGFQSMPSFSSVRNICDSSDWHPLSSFWIQRNHHKNGMEEIISQIKDFFRLPFFEESTSISANQFDSFCYLSQLTQAICVKAQSEHYRRLRSSRSNCMGALYWQCNDIWQAPTWSSIEYNGNWKVLHYFVKDFFSPVIVSVFENHDECEIHLSNDTLGMIQGIVTIDFITYTNSHKKTLSVPFDVSENNSKCIYKIDCLRDMIKRMGLHRNEVFLFLSCDVFSGKGSIRSDDDWEIVPSVETISNLYFPSSFESVKLADPKIQVSEMQQLDLRTFSLYVTSCAVALFVWLESPIDGRFSKNAFLLLPGQSELIKFKCWSTMEDFKYFKAKLAIRSLWDTTREINRN